MVDINKYFNTQQVLAKQRNVDKYCKEILSVSQKSKSAAEHISKKQDKTFTKNILNLSIQKDASLSEPITPELSACDSDKEYLPTPNDEENVKAAPSHSRNKSNLKKTIDDGDHILYKKRVSNWRKNLSSAKLKKFHGSYHSADIQYILEASGDPDDVHKIHNDLRVPKFIWKKLYKYQRSAVKWLWELHKVQSGGMLGDEMGLGKTVQVIAFLAGLSKVDAGSWCGLGPSIIVAPATVIYQWVSHFHYWCPQLRVAVLHHTGSHSGSYKNLIKDINATHGILLISYAGIVKYTKDLLSKKWHYIILDEGHKIRNPDTQVSKLVKKFGTPHKLIITGSPMQNSLQELWSLFDFMRPGLLGTYKAFMDHFAVPITQGGYANATELQKATALEIAKALKNIITPYMLRRTKAEVQEHIKLPEKNEQVLLCALTKEQKDLYMGYILSGIVKSILDKDDKFKGPTRAKILVALSTLTKICNHPDLYLSEALENFNEQGDEFGHWKRSGKMSVVYSLIKLWQKQGHRTLIFTQSRGMIRIFERHFQNYEFKYLKMDGTVTISQRQNLIKTFNENPEYLVFLSTTKVGGLGVNLTGADRVILYDPDWNPATDNQAKERAWRIGQTKNVTVYRLLSAGTIEEKIYQRQIFKNYLSNKILIDPSQKNVLTTRCLQGLFTLEDLNCHGDTETASLFKHTKINLYNREKNEKTHLTDSISLSKKKVEEMRKRAKEISKNISEAVNNNNDTKRQMIDIRELPVRSETEILINKKSNISVENLLSEVEIINKHKSKDYEENLIKESINSHNTKSEGAENKKFSKFMVNHIKTKFVNVESNEKIFIFNETPPIALNKLKEVKRNEAGRVTTIKRKHSSSVEQREENLLSKKNVKNKPHKKEKQANLKDDDYILSKLFATATVKNALQHDMIGLAEKERNYRMKELAVENANKAVTAIKLSRELN